MSADKAPMSDRGLIPGRGPEGQPVISGLVGRSFAIEPDGTLEDLNDFELQTEPEYYDLDERSGYVQPSLLARDMDVYPWREATDLVVQGVARAPGGVRHMGVSLRCRGSQQAFDLLLDLHGDRRVERGLVGLQLSEPEFFEEMPLRYDFAYGGTDEQARLEHEDTAREKAIFDIVGPEEDRESSRYSYPRNPAGKGYVVDPSSLLETEWPNIEFRGDHLSLDRAVAGREDWGARPYPAGFDWFPHAWFPRSALFGIVPEVVNERVPWVEAELGLLSPGARKQPLHQRPSHRFAQGAHPFLWRYRLTGDEEILVDAVGDAGSMLRIALPGLRPSARVDCQDVDPEPSAMTLDLVFVEAEARRVTMLWRTLLPVTTPAALSVCAGASLDVQWK